MKTIFKIKMTRQEMEAAFSALHPFLVPNNTNIGIFAKKNGYVRTQQMINGKIEKFYYKADKLS